MAKFDIFSFCKCKNIATHSKTKLKKPWENKTDTSSISPEYISSSEDSFDIKFRTNKVADKNGNERESSNQLSEYVRGSSSDVSRTDVTVSITEPDDLLHISRENAYFAWTTSSDPESKSLQGLVRKKRVELRKVHAKLKLELTNFLKMREQLDSSKSHLAANLPDLVASDTKYSDSDFLREFRQVFDVGMADLSAPANELKELSEKYKSLFLASKYRENIANETEQKVGEESKRVVQDSNRIITMLKQAMKLATIEYKLKICLVESKSVSSCQCREDLETALLELQRLKSSSTLDFRDTGEDEEGISRYEDQEGSTCASIGDGLRELFQKENILYIEKEAKLKLAELHIAELDIKYRQNDARFQLARAVGRRCESDLNAAITFAKKSGLSPVDDVRSQAEKVLSEIIDETHTCRKRLRDAIDASSPNKIEQELSKLESLNISKYDSVVLESKRVLKELREKEVEVERFRNVLKKAMKKKNADEIQEALVNIKSIQMNNEKGIVEEATKLLAHLRRTKQEKQEDVMEASRVRLLQVLDSPNSQTIAEALVNAQTAGLSNCVEIMGARTKLAQIQNDKERYSVELKKMEEYLEKISAKAEDQKATVDMVMTLKRAAAVAERLELSPHIIQRAQNALDTLNLCKDEVKRVKDDIQRAVMECRHESIICAIAEAESLSYFLTFDPLDGQIAAILEYAKNKIAPHTSPSITGEGRTSVQRVRSNLKRAMKGNSSAKLESAISVYRGAFAIPKNQEYPTDSDSISMEDEENASLLRRADRRCRRMKRQEKLAEKEWKNIRETMRQNIKSAMKERDRAEIWKAVYQFKRELGSSLDKEDESLLNEARKHLREVTVEQFKANLFSALEDRDCARLKHSLSEVDSPSLAAVPTNLAVKFKDEIARARKLVDHLKEMERLKKSVSEMNRSQIAEIHRYPSPPLCVRSVMTATYILMGESDKIQKDWTTILRLMVKMGRESLTRRVATCNPNHISRATAECVNGILSEFTLQQVQDVSKGAAVFFAWSKSIVEEVMDRHKDDEPKPNESKNHLIKEKPKEVIKDPIKSEFWNRLSRPRSSATIQRPLRALRMAPRPTSAMK